MCQLSPLLHLSPLICVWIAGAGAIPYSEYILAPSSRTLFPTSIYKVNGSVSGADSLTSSLSGSATFHGNSAITFDFGKNVGGYASVQFGKATTGCVGITFSESSLWISGVGSDATADAGIDEPLWFCAEDANAHGVVTADADHDRGAFRYLSLVRNGTGSTTVTQVSTFFTAQPHLKESALRQYTGYFHSNDDKLNRVWYAGAYTNQLDTIDPTKADALVWLRIINSGDQVTSPLEWYNNHTIANGTSVLTDGAKRDRLVWAGDMSIAVPGIAVSTNDLIPVKNALDSLFLLQTPEGQLPYAGVPFNELGIVSFTYHLYSLIGVSDYYHFSSNTSFLEEYWDQWKLGIGWSLSAIDDSGLMNVTEPADWLRFGMGGHNIEANAILYYTLNLGIKLAEIMHETSTARNWEKIATKIKVAANELLWDESVGMYRDNETTTLNPQDGNVWAVKANLTDSVKKTSSISANLQNRWTPFGAPAPEAADAISPFISGFELEAHFLAGETTRGLDLVRMMWADFMLDDPRMTNSTFIEGYSTTGELHYAPYTNDPRISHAHGWATGPTCLMTFYIAGIHLVEASGSVWMMKPQFGDLTSVDAGFVTSLGQFKSAWSISKRSGAVSFNFTTPAGTTGSMEVDVPSCNGIGVGHKVVKSNLSGGSYQFEFDCVE